MARLPALADGVMSSIEQVKQEIVEAEKIIQATIQDLEEKHGIAVTEVRLHHLSLPAQRLPSTRDCRLVVNLAVDW